MSFSNVFVTPGNFGCFFPTKTIILWELHCASTKQYWSNFHWTEFSYPTKKSVTFVANFMQPLVETLPSYIYIWFTAMRTKAAPPYVNLVMGRRWKNHPRSLHLDNPVLEKVHRWHLPDFLGTVSQLQSLQDFMNHLHPIIKFTFQHSTQQIFFLDMNI